MVFGDAKYIWRDKIYIGKEPTNQDSHQSRLKRKDHAYFHIDQYAILNIAIRWSKRVVFIAN